MKKILFLFATAFLMTACGQHDTESVQKPNEPEKNEAQEVVPDTIKTQIQPQSQDSTITITTDTPNPNTPVLNIEEGMPLDLSQLMGGQVSIEERVASQIDSIRYKAEHGDANYQYAYGVCYEKGWGVEQNMKEAFAWYQKAAKQKNGPAYNSIGNLYRTGNGVKADPKQAFEWYEKGAAVNDDQAMLNLGNCYFYGMGTEKDEKTAVQWWSKSAEVGNAYAISQMGDCYHYGIVVEKNLAKAVENYTQAANKNVPSAQYNLGIMYYNGSGVNQDQSYARLLMRKASDGGMKEAQDFLEKNFKD